LNFREATRGEGEVAMSAGTMRFKVETINLTGPDKAGEIVSSRREALVGQGSGLAILATHATIKGRKARVGYTITHLPTGRTMSYFPLRDRAGVTHFDTQECYLLKKEVAQLAGERLAALTDWNKIGCEDVDAELCRQVVEIYHSLGAEQVIFNMYV